MEINIWNDVIQIKEKNEDKIEKVLNCILSGNNTVFKKADKGSDN